MLNLNNRFDTHAYRVADFEFSSTMLQQDTIEEGSWVSLNTDGKLIPATNSTGKAFILLTSKKPGRDYITGTGAAPKGSVLMGVAILDTDVVTPTSIVPGKALKIGTDGKLAIDSDGSATVAFALSAPAAGTNVTRIYILP